jgi:Protein of unknown function (DUF3467)
LLQFEVPDGLAAGVYSNVVGVWHTPYEFTLDFGVFQPPQTGTTEAGAEVPVLPVRIVARVKIPPAAVFELMQALSTNEKIYEVRFGQIQRPGPPDAGTPLYPPGEPGDDG